MPNTERPVIESRDEQPSAVQFGDVQILPGTRDRIELRVARLPTETWLSMPVEVIHGRRPGPRMWISAAVHGDEVAGVEIIRRLRPLIDPGRLAGTLFIVPIVNVFGFLERSRYLPDRRDLNRSFPGSASGSLAARLAHLFLEEIVARCTHGIDLHTGSNHRTNLPQIRGDFRDPQTRHLAESFGAPVIMHAQTRDGSLREAAAARGISCLLFEGGEALRLDEPAVRAGTEGILRVMTALGMLTGSAARVRRPLKPTVEVHKSTWVRARRGGMIHLDVSLGDQVKSGQPLGAIADTFGDVQNVIVAPFSGLIIGQSNLPLANQGDGILHLARVVTP